MDNIITDLQPKLTSIVLNEAKLKINSEADIKVKFDNSKTSDVRVEISLTGNVYSYHLAKLLFGCRKAIRDYKYSCYVISRAEVNEYGFYVGTTQSEENLVYDLPLSKDKDNYILYEIVKGNRNAIAVMSLESVLGYLITKLQKD